MNNLMYRIAVTARRCSYIMLGYIDTFLARKNPLVILCYHSISDNDWHHGVSLANLEAHMRYMLSQYAPVRLADVLTKGLEKPSFVVTFDDGYENIYAAKKLFSKLGIKPTVFVISDTLHANRNLLETNLSLLSAAKIRELKKSGWEIGGHTKTHELLPGLHARELQEQIGDSKKQYASFSYPHGLYDRKTVAAVVKAGYKIGVSMDDHLITKQSNPFTLPRVGVNNSHSLSEFMVLASPSVLAFRRIAKSLIRFISV